MSVGSQSTLVPRAMGRKRKASASAAPAKKPEKARQHRMPQTPFQQTDEKNAKKIQVLERFKIYIVYWNS